MCIWSQAYTYIRTALLGDGFRSPVSSDDAEADVTVRDGRTKAKSLGSSVAEEKASDLTVSLWRDDDAKVSGAIMALSELQARDVVVS